MRTLDFETPAELRRIQLIKDIVNEPQMSKRLEIVREYDSLKDCIVCWGVGKVIVEGIERNCPACLKRHGGRFNQSK